jgi:hypothetical protein
MFHDRTTLDYLALLLSLAVGLGALGCLAFVLAAVLA